VRFPNSWRQSFVVVVCRELGHFSFSHKNKVICDNEYGNYDDLRNKTLNRVRLWWMTSVVFWSEPKASKGEWEYESNSECNEEPIVDIIMGQVGSRLGLSTLHRKV
jgi:hypothetical protein